MPGTVPINLSEESLAENVRDCKELLDEQNKNAAVAGRTTAFGEAVFLKKREIETVIAVAGRPVLRQADLFGEPHRGRWADA